MNSNFFSLPLLPPSPSCPFLFLLTPFHSCPSRLPVCFPSSLFFCSAAVSQPLLIWNSFQQDLDKLRLTDYFCVLLTSALRRRSPIRVPPEIPFTNCKNRSVCFLSLFLSAMTHGSSSRLWCHKGHSPKLVATPGVRCPSCPASVAAWVQTCWKSSKESVLWQSLTVAGCKQRAKHSVFPEVFPFFWLHNHFNLLHWIPGPS